MIWAVIGTRSSEGSLARLANSPVEKDIFEIMGQICRGVAGSWTCPTDFPPKMLLFTFWAEIHWEKRFQEPWTHQHWGEGAAWSSLLHSQVVPSLPAAAHEHLGTSQTSTSSSSMSIH